MYILFGKRLIDIIAGFFGILFLLPVFLIVAVLIKIKLGSPVLFRQERPGRHGKIFTVFKFRTMNDARDIDGCLLPDTDRLTKFGKTLRSTSLDELPELWNILKGDMSLVGPRPLRVEYLPLYSSEQMRRHDIKPGLTGHAQVNGRNSISWDEKFTYDCWYIDNINFRLDMKIIFVTVGKVLGRKEITSQTSDTMEPFVGKEEIFK